MKKLFLALIGLVVVGLVAGSCGSKERPAAQTYAQPTAMPLSTVQAAPAGIYYLWYKSNPSVGVAVLGPSHKSGPVDGNQLMNWVLAGTACVADAGTKAYRGSTSAPSFTWAVEVGEGACRGFAGWVGQEAIQKTPR